MDNHLITNPLISFMKRLGAASAKLTAKLNVDALANVAMILFFAALVHAALLPSYPFGSIFLALCVARYVFGPTRESEAGLTLLSVEIKKDVNKLSAANRIAFEIARVLAALLVYAVNFIGNILINSVFVLVFALALHWWLLPMYGFWQIFVALWTLTYLFAPQTGFGIMLDISMYQLKATLADVLQKQKVEEAKQRRTTFQFGVYANDANEDGDNDDNDDNDSNETVASKLN